MQTVSWKSFFKKCFNENFFTIFSLYNFLLKSEIFIPVKMIHAYRENSNNIEKELKSVDLNLATPK